MTPTAIAATAKPPRTPRQLIRSRGPQVSLVSLVSLDAAGGQLRGPQREPSQCHIGTVRTVALSHCDGCGPGSGAGSGGRTRLPGPLLPVETVDPADNGRACSSNAHSQGNAPDRIHVVMATSGPHPCRWGRAWDGGWQGSGSPGAPGAPCDVTGSLGGFRDGGQDPVQAEIPGLLDVAAEPERPRELHHDEPVRPRHHRARRGQGAPRSG